MKDSFSLTISLPAQHLITFEAKIIMVPASDGYLGFMAGRQPLIASLGPGLIHILDITDKDYWLGTTGGFCEMLDNQAILLCDSIIGPEDVQNLEEEPDTILYRKEAKAMSEKQRINYVKKLLAEKLQKLEEAKKLETTNE